MSLGDLFPDDLRRKFAEQNISIGSTLLIELSGIQQKYPKYIIIVSENEEELLLAYVIINSEINENLFPTPYLKSLHIKIEKENHGFLSYDSYINCSEIKTIKKPEVIDFLINHPERAVGNINENLLKSVHHTISIAKTIPLYLKKKFGF